MNPYVYPVVEFWRSGITPDGLTPGRIWADFDRPELDSERQKLFRSWFRRLARYLDRWPYRWGFYRIGPKTKEYVEKGGKFVAYGVGDPKSITNLEGVQVIRSQCECFV